MTWKGLQSDFENMFRINCKKKKHYEAILIKFSKWILVKLKSNTWIFSLEYDSQGRLIDTDKWDNHNTIARGWVTAGEDHYQPVTFRKIYGTKSVTGPSPLPTSSTIQKQHQAPIVSEQEAQPPNDEGYADLWSFRI